MGDLDDLFGESAAMETVRETIRRLVARQQPGRRLPAILIQGETGTGKGLVTHLIHRLGPRSRGPFVDVNCAAIPEHLLESELFGFERGAFTDARRAKAGLFQTAHQGTLFLDEIGLLPEVLQAKLLTVIEERAVRRLGSTRSEPADAWIISATSTDLPAAIRERRFREDLYHRLAVLTIKLPPLRERDGDTLLLAERFLASVCNDYGLSPKTLASDARERLVAYPWPGNVRELANVIERAVLQADGSTVSARHLELREDASVASSGGREPGGAAGVSMGDAMREHLRTTLEQTGWNISRTAAILRMSRNTLRARIEKLGLRGGTDAHGATQVGERSQFVSATPVPSLSAENQELPAKAVAPTPSGRFTPPPIRWQRRRITLLRASLTVAEVQDDLPETSRTLEVLVDKIHTFGGRVEELGQTGMDASFGLEPIEDAPRRAANAAIAILKAMERVRSQHAEILAIKIAMHTGPYTVGQINDVPQIDQTAKRQAAAILDALVEAAEPDSAVISGATVPFLERRFELIPSGAAAGITGQPYRLAGREVVGLGLWGRMGKFVGRRHELELLRHRWVSALQGRGQLVALVGEPGVGKSRLAWEFTHSLESSGQWRLMETSSVALANPTPYLPIIELLKRYLQIDTGEDPNEVRLQVSEKLRGLDETLVPILPALLSLLDLLVADSQWQALSPLQRRQRTFDGVKRLLLRESRRQPLLVVFEDTHWLDVETQALLDSIVEALPTSNILLLLTYRPEYQHGWNGKTFYTQLRVDPLPPDSSEELLAALLGYDPSLAPLKAMLIEWTEGNPFFLEESARTLIETEAFDGERGAYRLAKPVENLQVPATVEEVLAARIDRLAAEQHRLLQSAAVIGKDVPYPVLAAISDLPEEALGESLRQLQASEFLYETVASPEREYTFKHALTHEVAYASIAQGKRALHARIVDVMETLYGDRLAEHVDRLAHHAFRGQVWDKALVYLRRAGMRALHQSANREAAAFFEQALEAVEHLPKAPDLHGQAIDLCIYLRNALTLLGEPQRILEHLRRAETLAERIDDRFRLCRVLSFEANCLVVLGQHEPAIEAGRRALDIATSLDDFSLKTATQQYVGRAHHALGDYQRGIAIFGGIVRSLTGGLALEHLGLPVIPAVFSRSHLALCLAEVGMFDEALRHGNDAIRLAEATNHPDTLLWACRATGLVELARGGGEQAKLILERALSLCHTYDMPAYTARVLSELGLAYAMCALPSEALSHGKQGVENSLATRQTVNFPGTILRLGQINLLAGRLKQAEDSGARALELFRALRERGNEAHTLHLLGEIFRQSDPPDGRRAEHAYSNSMELAGERGMRPLIARCRFGLGLLYEQHGERLKARDTLADAVTLFREMTMTAWLSSATEALARLS